MSLKPTPVASPEQQSGSWSAMVSRPLTPSTPPPTLAAGSSPKARSSRPMAVQWRVAKGWAGSLGSTSKFSGRQAVSTDEEAPASGTMTTPAQRRIERLEGELQSLREAYSRKIAATELRCERLLAEKDSETTEWYKEKKHEIKKMQAALTIMKALFDKKRKKVEAGAEVAKADFLSKQCLFREQVAVVEEKCRTEVDAMREDFEQRTADMEAQIVDLRTRVETLTTTKTELQEQLAKEKSDVHRLSEEVEGKRLSIKELQRQLSEARQADQVAVKTKQIEDLEAELKRTRRVLQKQNQKENEGLRKEVMDYIQFIVHKLPVDWEERREVGGSGGYEVPAYLRQKFNLALEERSARCSPPPTTRVSAVLAYEGSSCPQLSPKGVARRCSLGGGVAGGILPHVLGSGSMSPRSLQAPSQLQQHEHRKSRSPFL